MKVQKNITVFSGAKPGRENIAAQHAKKEGTAQKKSTYFAGNIAEQGSLRDRIALRRKDAQKQAMKVVGDVWSSERAVDEDLQARRDLVKGLQQENKELQGQINELEEQQAALQEQYGISDGDTSKMNPENLTDYQKQQLDLDEFKKYYQDQIDENDKKIKQEIGTIHAMRKERLKSSPMVKAQKEAEKIKDAAGDEIVGMVVEDAKDHIDEEQEEREEQAEEIKEEQEELEELREKQKEHKEEWEEFLENMPTDQLLSLDKDGKDLQQEVQNIMNKMKLIAEDMKGAKVDEKR